MKHILSILLLQLLLLAAHSQPKYEVRAVWLATIGGLDWPSSYAADRAGAARQRRQLTDMLDRLQAAGVNTVLLQTRVRATTIYPSDLEPWDGCLSGHPGQSPGYDALQVAIEECHRRGMELQAWIVTIPVGKWQSYGCQQLRRHNPRLVKKIGDEGYMDPESPETATYLARFCEEVTRRYDVDGIHLDYIRYPETWRGARRADNITRIVRAVSQRVKSVKPWVKMSCAPIGKYDDLSRYSSRGWNARRQGGQDAQGWLRQGLMDQLYPMMYFQGDHFYPFAIDWQEHTCGRTVVSGLGIYLLHPREGKWQLSEVKRQLNVTRSIGLGHCYYRAKFLLDNVKGVLDYASHFDRMPALVPPMTWAQQPAPLPPSVLDVSRTAHGDRLTWNGGRDRSQADYLLYNVYASRQWPVDTGDPANLVAVRRSSRQLTIAAKGPYRYYAVAALDRYGNESSALQEPAPPAAAPRRSAVLMANDGLRLTLPEATDADYLAVCTLQGSIVHTVANAPVIDISRIPEGIYELRSLHPKGVSHRIGHFIIRRH